MAIKYTLCCSMSMVLHTRHGRAPGDSSCLDHLSLWNPEFKQLIWPLLSLSFPCLQPNMRPSHSKARKADIEHTRKKKVKATGHFLRPRAVTGNLSPSLRPDYSGFS